MFFLRLVYIDKICSRVLIRNFNFLLNKNKFYIFCCQIEQLFLEILRYEEKEQKLVDDCVVQFSMYYVLYQYILLESLDVNYVNCLNF